MFCLILNVYSIHRQSEKKGTQLVTHSSLLCSRKANCGKRTVPGLMGESESSTADFAGKAFEIPLGSAFNARKKALVPRVYQGMGLARGSRARWESLSKALLGLCRFASCFEGSCFNE